MAPALALITFGAVHVHNIVGKGKRLLKWGCYDYSEPLGEIASRFVAAQLIAPVSWHLSGPMRGPHGRNQLRRYETRTVAVSATDLRLLADSDLGGDLILL